ncbi:uncharacterized protein LOC130130746 [Lampris incognitus]|uniref:uncharacterized protein LOC130130746 n=1 Tax=Lampris incognitus TaxID=2546036 RepID=UPI0024B54A34|nr:uncharacterized protein LOC130130746 [Lampris incognitus]XP_056156526.1 uncharacterized protein LOC130130746 [Lampris incognitus]
MKKRYDPRDSSLRFVDGQDDLDPLASEDEDGSLKAKMSCGHTVTPDSLTRWCRSLLDQGQYELRCPALTKGVAQCKAVWSYPEVRRLAALTVGEMQYFEERISRLAAANYCDAQQCPGCKTAIERKNPSNLCVKCIICTADRKQACYFCWQCLKPWKGTGPRSDRCDNNGCINKDLELLQICRSIDLPDVTGVTSCPSVRLCPTCGIRVEHNRRHCKNIVCPRCQVEFCFVCLKTKRECSKTSTPYRMCHSGVAPRQTAVPVWRRNKRGTSHAGGSRYPPPRSSPNDQQRRWCSNQDPYPHPASRPHTRPIVSVQTPDQTGGNTGIRTSDSRVGGQRNRPPHYPNTRCLLFIFDHVGPIPCLTLSCIA